MPRRPPGDPCPPTRPRDDELEDGEVSGSSQASKSPDHREAEGHVFSLIISTPNNDDDEDSIDRELRGAS